MRVASCCLALLFAACTASVPVGEPKPSGGSNQPAGTPIKDGECTGGEEKECVTGQVCNTEKQLCVDTCQSELDCEVDGEACNDKGYCSSASASCENANQCADGEICKDNTCQKPGRCNTKDDCPANHTCFQNACLSNSTGSCRTDADCSKSAQCQNGGCKCENNVCKVNAGAKCTPQDAHTVCAAGQFCDSGVCVAARPCTVQTDCLGNLVCLSGYCKTPKPCVNGQCDAGFTCQADFCVSDQTGKTCASDNECGNGFYCNIGVSIPGQPAGGTCQPGCKSDAECPTQGDKCDLSVHQCLPPGSTATKCDFDSDCDPSCANGQQGNAPRCGLFARSDKVCDVTFAQQSAGGKQGLCRDRCIKNAFTGELVGCPGGKTCVTQSFTLNSTDQAVYCGSGNGGYSACY